MRVYRIGRPSNTTNSTANRRVKLKLVVLKLSSAANYKHILSHSNPLKDSKITSVYVKQPLSRDDAEKIKNLRKECCDLNKDWKYYSQDRKLFIVVSEK